MHNYYGSMPDDSLRLDPAALAVLAHPLRTRLLGALRIDGPATATALADRFETNTGATSYHLRKLASVGLVEDTDTGTGRRRVWRATTTFTDFEPSDFLDDPESAAALGWLQRHHFDELVRMVHTWQEARPEWPARWQDAAGMSDVVITVTPDQLRAIADEVWEVLVRHVGEDNDDPDARRVALHLLATPLDPQDVPAGSAGGEVR